MNIRILETFLWLGNLKSFSKTAKQLRTTQSVVSMRIAGLQRQLGVELYSGQGRTFELTDIGRRVMRKCEAIVLLANELEEEVRAATLPSAQIRLGAAEIVGLSWLPELLAGVSSEAPGLRLSIQTGVSGNLVEALRRAEIDLVFGVGPVNDPTLVAEYLCQFTVKWLAAPQLVCERVPTGVLDLAKLPIIGSPMRSYRYQKVVEYFQWHNASHEEGLRPASWVDLGFNMTTCAHLASRGVGVTALPVCAAEGHVRSGDLMVLPIQQEFLPWQIVALTRRNADPEPVSSIVKCARSAMERYARTCDPSYFQIL